MMRIGPLTLRLLGATLFVLSALAVPTQADEGIKITPDVVYGHKHGMALTMDVYQPTSGNGVGILFMVSGGWYSMWAPPEQTMGLFRPLLDKGFTVFAVRHGSSPKYVVPEVVVDVRRSVRFVRLHAQRFGVDPERLGVCGWSAGGHLSLVLGTMSDAGDPEAKDEVLRVTDRVAAVVAYFPPTDLRPYVKIDGPYRERFPALKFDPNQADSVSPLRHVSPDDPPTLLVHGDKDMLVPIWHSEKIRDAFRENDVDCELLVIEGAAHGFAGDDAERANAAWVAWFEKHLLGAKTGSALSSSVRLIPGPVNGVMIERSGHRLVVYGDPSGTVPRADMVLFTHGRRDVSWAGRGLVERQAKAVMPEAEASTFAGATDFWQALVTARFHDYQQQTTKLRATPLRVDRTVADGDTIEWQDVSLKVIATPGYTRGAVSYVAEIDDITYAFVGDTIYGDGLLLDLYSLQDAIAEAKIGGYHGYAGRIGELIRSLRIIRACDPDILVPARGPVVRDPKTSLTRLIGRLQAAYSNYLSINAGRWYFKERYDALVQRALDTASEVRWMDWATTIEENPPGWVVPIQNSRLLLSESGAGWLIDCGSQAIIDEIKKLRHAGRLTSLEGLFITHYHDDHTDKVNELREAFPCPVYVTPLMEDILRHPAAYRLPAMTSHAIADLTVVPDRHTQRWREFQLTFYDYPGQTLYHDALLVEHDNGETLFFLGDSFTPSGIDDYCLLNRNLMHEGDGYLYCLDVLETLPADCLLVNEHVGPAFRFDKPQLAHMRSVLQQRKELLAELFPWDEANYGIDERWARLYPYGQTARPGEIVEIEVRILNHSDRAHEYTVTPHVPEGFRVQPDQTRLTIDPREERAAIFEVSIPASTGMPVAVVTADVAFNQWDLRQWCEGILQLEP
ncbi:MAG: prolyl oligopeptidase family serine peptidase [Phycisphaerales bacterium]|nr:MAG: prolyl oligopeptidase family serine peptidase [Phycisphaerales bacterium]